MTSHSLLASAIALLALIPPGVSAQDSTGEGDGPEWVVADSNLVYDPPWTGGTVAKNVVVLMFRRRTTPARRASILKQIRGTLVHFDHWTDTYLVRVATHPDACGVRQALDLLHRIPEVEMAEPEGVFSNTQHDSIDAGSGVGPAAATHHGSNRPCPPGTALLR